MMPDRLLEHGSGCRDTGRHRRWTLPLLPCRAAFFAIHGSGLTIAAQ
jgi:hypothetical protein